MIKKLYYCDRCEKQIDDIKNVATMIASLYFVEENKAGKYNADKQLCPTCAALYIKRIKQFLEERKDDRDNN